jgi:hypothetical protein
MDHIDLTTTAGRRRVRRALAVLSAAATFSAIAAAQASPPCECVDTPLTSPTNGTTGIPTNTRFYLSWSGLDGSTIELSQGGQAVDAAVEVVGGSQWSVVPAADLLADTEYVLRADAEGTPVELSWRTGAGADDAAPELASATIAGAALPGACESHAGAEVSISGLADDLATEDAMVLRVDFEGGAFPPVFLHTGAPLYFGNVLSSDSDWQDCLDNALSLEPGVDYAATVTALDWAGNASAPSDPSAFQLTEGGGASCFCSWGAAAPAPGPGVAAGAALALAAVLRRGRRRSTTAGKG